MAGRKSQTMLSSIEINERVRSLRVPQRVGYTLSVSVAVVIAFWFSVLIAVALAALVVLVIIGGPLLLEDVISLALPVSIFFMLTVGMGGVSSGEGVAPGQTIGSHARHSMRHGIVVGCIFGAVCGTLWSFLIQANPLLFALVMALAIGPTYALFRGIAVIIEPLCLRLVAGRK
jgi:hypothetical protein